MKMKYLFLPLLITFLISACTANTEETLFFVSSKETLGAKKIGCDEYLVPVQVAVKGKGTLGDTVQMLFDANPADFGPNLTTATVYKDKYFILENFIQPEKPNNQDPFRVFLKKDHEKFDNITQITIGVMCDITRFEEQLTETVRAYAEKRNAPFQINLDGAVKNWECLGNESENCL